MTSIFTELAGLSFRDIFLSLSRQELQNEIPGFDLENLTTTGQLIGDFRVCWISAENTKILAFHKEGKNSLGETHDFSFRTNKELIGISFSIDEQQTQPTVMDEIVRLSDQENDHDLPPGFTMKLYDKLPVYLQVLASKKGVLNHELTMGHWRDRRLPRDKWLAKFLPFIDKYDYHQLDGLNTWVHLYSGRQA